ncbi:hypothetical protein ACFYYN_25815 [Streptomyces sp. NPDC001902]
MEPFPAPGGGTALLCATVAADGFRRHATYRVAPAAGVLTDTAFGSVAAYT